MTLTAEQRLERAFGEAQLRWWDADSERYLAQAAAAREEAAKNAADARKLLAEAEYAEVQARMMLRQERDYLATDSENYTYAFTEPVGENSVGRCIKQLTRWARKNGDDPITVELVLNSPGGSIIDGFALIDFIIAMRDKGHTINTHAIGMAASMAGVLLQAGTTRTMGSNAVLLVHEAQFTAIGNFGQVKDTVKLVEKLQDRIVNLFVARSGGKLTDKAFRELWERKDAWLTSDESLELGMVDAIR